MTSCLALDPVAHMAKPTRSVGPINNAHMFDRITQNRHGAIHELHSPPPTARPSAHRPTDLASWAASVATAAPPSADSACVERP